MSEETALQVQHTFLNISLPTLHDYTVLRKTYKIHHDEVFFLILNLG